MTRPGPLPVPAADRPGRNAARGHVSAADDRSPVDRRNRDYLLVQPYWAGRHGRECSTWPRPRADLGILAREQATSPRWQTLVFYNSGQVSRRLMPLWWAFLGVAGPGGRRDLCRGAVRSAALRGGPVGRRLLAPVTGRPEVDLGSRTTSPSSLARRLGQAELRLGGNPPGTAPSGVAFCAA
jgi:hypothetical protein